jgi:hypothetical protein
MSDIEKGHVDANNGHHALGRTDARVPGAHIANPAVLGLFSFASTTFMLSMYNAQVRDISHPNVVVGMAIFCGGLAQLLAGMWEFPKGNTFGATGKSHLTPLRRCSPFFHNFHCITFERPFLSIVFVSCHFTHRVSLSPSIDVVIFILIFFFSRFGDLSAYRHVPLVPPN